MYTIKNPEELTYYIVYDAARNWVHYGSVDSNNEMTTQLEIMETYLDETIWRERLLNEFSIEV